VHLELEFANDGLSCEWAYVVDLDKEVFEIYGGCEKKHDGHRFKDVGDEEALVPAFICSFDFRELYLMKSGEEFLDKVIQAIDEKMEVDDEASGLDEKQEEEEEEETEEETEEEEEEEKETEEEEEKEDEDGAEGSR